VTVVESRPAPTGKSKRGRETVFDMVRSLAVVFLLVVPLWFFGQASPQDSKRIRAVDPSEALQEFVQSTGVVGTSFLAGATGRGKPVGTVDVAGVPWQDWRSQDGHESLVRTAGKVTVLVGGLREDASLEQLKALAATVR
jgi:hypothetical protein